MAKMCLNCSFHAPDNAKFCPRCGQAVDPNSPRIEDRAVAGRRSEVRTGFFFIIISLWLLVFVYPRTGAALFAIIGLVSGVIGLFCLIPTHRTPKV